MRQLFVLALLAAIGWWVYDSSFVEPAQAATPSGSDSRNDPGSSAGEGAPTLPLADVLRGGSQNQGRTDQGTQGDGSSSDVPVAQVPVEKPAAGNPQVALDADGQQALQALIDGIGELKAAAIDRGWDALASGRLAAGPVRRLLDALVADGEFDQQLARLGSNNRFLQLDAGRKQAEKVFALAMRLPDAKAVPSGTRFLEACLRGHIEKNHAAARAVVDRTYATYRVRAQRWLCDPQNVAGARSYTVVGGDSLNRIARKFRREGLMVDEGTIALLNRIHNKNAIKKGQRLKIPVEPIRAVVQKRSFSLAVYIGDDLLRLYWVGLGENDKTPVTTFTVVEKQPRPEWTAPDGRVLPYGHHENILGEFFIKFGHASYTGFGAHGTPQPETICTMSSAGCLRMYAPDIAELFEILPRGATVEIRASE